MQIDRKKLIPRMHPTVPLLKTATMKKEMTPFDHLIGPVSYRNWEDSNNQPEKLYLDTRVIFIVFDNYTLYTDLVIDIVNSFPEKEYKIIIKGNQTLDVSRIESEKQSKNLNYEVVCDISLPDYLIISDIAIFEGNQEMALNILNAGLLSVIVPFNGEHFKVAKQIEEQECGLVLWKYPADILQKEIKKTILSLFDNKKYNKNIMLRKQELLPWVGGAEKAMAIIEAYCEKAIKPAQKI
jgi:UDP:flavonoid glycosyltransferase YjiC (YdhE family)